MAVAAVCLCALQLSTPTEEERRSFCHRLSHHATGSMGSAWAEKEWNERAMYAFVRARSVPARARPSQCDLRVGDGASISTAPGQPPPTALGSCSQKISRGPIELADACARAGSEFGRLQAASSGDKVVGSGPAVARPTVHTHISAAPCQTLPPLPREPLCDFVPAFQ